MKAVMLALLVLIALATCFVVYDSLESGANMLEILLMPLTTDKTAAGAMVVAGPFLAIFIAFCALKFVGVPLACVAVAALFAGWGLRRSGRTISPRSGWLAAAVTGACAMAIVVLLIQPDILPVSRPPRPPRTSPGVLAFLVGANAALSVYVGSRLMRRVAAAGRPPAQQPSAAA